MTITQHPIGFGFGAHSTVDDVLGGVDLAGRTAVVTGGYSGLGLHITQALVGAGARVVVPARRPAQARDALAGVDGAHVASCDLSDLGSVRRCARDVAAAGARIDMLICNAAVMAVPFARVGAGWESHFAINHLGHFALARALTPVLAEGVRVVSVSSAGHFLSGIRWDDVHFETGYDRWAAYGQSKTAASLFAVHANRVLGPIGGHAFSLHPGSILTPLQRHVPDAEQAALGWRTATGEPGEGFKTPRQGAATAVWAATDPRLVDHGGSYLQDCDVAEIATSEDMVVGGVKPWALDVVDAERLWALSATLTDVDSW